MEILGVLRKGDYRLDALQRLRGHRCCFPFTTIKSAFVLVCLQTLLDVPFLKNHNYIEEWMTYNFVFVCIVSRLRLESFVCQFVGIGYATRNRFQIDSELAPRGPFACPMAPRLLNL